MRKFFALSILIAGFFAVKAQDGYKWNDSVLVAGNPEQRNWNDIHLITTPTTKTVDKHRMEFNIMHRFGNIGGESGGGIHSLYGFDQASDIYFSFDYGILSNLQVGIGRSKQNQLIDLDIKYRPVTQTKGGAPVSLAIYEDIGYIPVASSTFYLPGNNNSSIGDRVTYLTQIILSRRFNRNISVELIPTLSERNHVSYLQNTNNGTWDENFIPAIGAGVRYMFNGSIGIIADYYYIISQYRQNNNLQAYYNAFSIALEMHTGGHVFHITLSNANSINPTNIIPYTYDSWRNGGFKLGFSISRLF